MDVSVDMSLLRCETRRSKIEIVKDATTGLRGSGEAVAKSSLNGAVLSQFQLQVNGQRELVVMLSELRAAQWQ